VEFANIPVLPIFLFNIARKQLDARFIRFVLVTGDYSFPAFACYSVSRKLL
jgi:hypothetical protein